MGNLCSKSSNEPDNFSTPGRTLAASNSGGATSASIPSNRVATTPGRTLGGRDGATGANDARGAAAKAAEERAARADTTKGGKLSTQLNAQKKQTRNELLGSASEAERRARDADEGAQARNWD